jgi:hypothetical protein
MTGRIGRQERMSRKLDADLDKALAQTFPASDPFSVGHITSTEPPSRSIDHKPPELKTVPSGRRKRKLAT